LKGEGDWKEREIGGEGMELREGRKEYGREGKGWGGREGEGWVIRERADVEKRKGREGRKGRAEEKGMGGPRKGLRPGPATPKAGPDYTCCCRSQMFFGSIRQSSGADDHPSPD
jgi:hypothetical protein